MIYLRR